MTRKSAPALVIPLVRAEAPGWHLAWLMGGGLALLAAWALVVEVLPPG